MEFTQKCIDVEESGILDHWNELDEVIDVSFNSLDDQESLTDDSMKKMFPIPKVYNKIIYFLNNLLTINTLKDKQACQSLNRGEIQWGMPSALTHGSNAKPSWSSSLNC